MKVGMRRYAALLTVLGASMAVAVTPAMAHEFIASKAGKVTDLNENIFVFTINPGSSDCTSVQGSSEVPKGKIKSLIVKLKYPRDCESFGYFGSASEAEYEISAEGSVTLLNKGWTVEFAPGCNIVFGGGGANKNIGTDTFSNKSSKVILTEKLSNLSYTEMVGCPGGEGKYSNALFSGKYALALEGGTLEWK